MAHGGERVSLSVMHNQRMQSVYIRKAQALYIAWKMKIPLKGYSCYILPSMIHKTGKKQGIYAAIQEIIWDKKDLRPLPHMGS